MEAALKRTLLLFAALPLLGHLATVPGPRRADARLATTASYLPAGEAPWFLGKRALDLTSDGQLDTVILRADGPASNKLSIVLTLVVAGQERWRESYPSDYELTDPPSFPTDAARDKYVRAALLRTLAKVAVGPFDSLSYRQVVESPDSLILRRPPLEEVTVSYGYETTVVLVWHPDSMTFRVLYECC
jgi:hypothetical protein